MTAADDREVTPGDGTSFEELLANPHLQFDLRDELLPHQLAFGPAGPAPARPWLFGEAVNTTVAAQSPDDREVTTAADTACGYCASSGGKACRIHPKAITWAENAAIRAGDKVPSVEQLRTLLAAAEARGVERGRTEAAEAIARLEAERDEARAELSAGRMAARRLTSVLIANASRLDTPFSNVAGTPWNTFVKPALERLRRALGMRNWMAAAVDQTAPSSPLETPRTADGGEAGVVEGAGGSEAAEAIRAQADHPCRCGHLRGHHTWRGRACQMCYGCPAFEEVLTDG